MQKEIVVSQSPTRAAEKLAFDPNHTISYGYYRCQTCGAEFYGGGRTLHNAGCATNAGYADLIYVFGPKDKNYESYAKVLGLS